MTRLEVSLEATAFEFRARVWLSGGLFLVAGLSLWIDPESVASRLLRLAGLQAGSPGWSHGMRALILFGATLVAAAAALRTWANAWLQSGVVRDRSLRTERLLVDGPYRHVRNPLYLGSLMFAVGLSLTTSLLGGLILLGGHLLLFSRIIRREEAAMLAAHGGAYQRYREAVPRLLPAARARLPASGAAPRWGQALRGESWGWGLAGSAFALAVTGSGAVFLASLVLSALSYLLLAPRGAAPQGGPHAV